MTMVLLLLGFAAGGSGLGGDTSVSAFFRTKKNL